MQGNCFYLPNKKQQGQSVFIWLFLLLYEYSPAVFQLKPQDMMIL
jgi:hypothetical protein